MFVIGQSLCAIRCSGRRLLTFDPAFVRVGNGLTLGNGLYILIRCCERFYRLLTDTHIDKHTYIYTFVRTSISANDFLSTMCMYYAIFAYIIYIQKFIYIYIRSNSKFVYFRLKELC